MSNAFDGARARIIDIVTTRRKRRLAYLIAILLMAFLSVWPKPYVARARILPQDTATAAGTGGIMSLVSGASAQNVASLLGGGRASNDLYLIIGRSDSVVRRVIRRLHLVGSNGYSNVDSAKRALSRKVDISLLLGGVMQIDTKTFAPDESYRITQAYVDALSKELAAFGEQNIINKKRIVEGRFAKASQRVAQTETAMNAFRHAHNLAAPDAQLGVELTLRTTLQAQYQARLVEEKTLAQFRGPESPELASVRTEIASLQQQLNRAASSATAVTGPNLAASGDLTTQYLSLYRDYSFAQAIYEVYARASEQIAIDELTAQTASYVQIIDRAYIDEHRHYNVLPVSILAIIVLLLVLTELYAPWTGLFNLDQLHHRDTNDV